MYNKKHKKINKKVFNAKQYNYAEKERDRIYLEGGS
jgi:hypothetical protein